MKGKFSSMWRVVIAVVMVLSLSLVTAVPAGAAEVATYYVATTGDDESIGSEGAPWFTIQHAIDVADDGDTIIVAAGIYNEEINITTSNISLLGEDRETTVINAGGVRWGTIDVTDASHIVISGFTLRNSGATQTRGVNITGTSQYITVEDCKIYSDDYGIDAHNNRAEGFHTFRNNIITSDWGGIHLEYTSQNMVTQNTISSATGWAGINLGIGGDDNTVQYNEISGCEYGVCLVMSQGGTSGNVISNNEITNNKRGIWWQRNPANVIEYNNIFNNTDYNLYANPAYFNLEAPAPAENNWWGQDPPEAAKFYGEVDYDPWSTVPNPIVPPTVEVWVDDDFTSATPGWGETQFATIQAGINVVAEGGTVNVAAGTYNEKLTITKPLILIGEGSIRPVVNIPDGDDGGVTITASDVTIENIHFYRLDQSPYGWSEHNCIINIPRGGSWEPGYEIVYERITLRDLVIEKGFRGAYVTAGDVTIEDCEFRDQASDALYFGAVSGTTCIRRNTFEEPNVSPPKKASRKAIVFQNFSDRDPATSGVINVESNIVDGKTNLLVYNQWIRRDGVGPVDIRAVGNSIRDLESYEGWNDIGSAVVIYGADHFGKVGSVLVQMNDFSGVPEGRWGVLGPPEVGVDATLNWWGSANGPEHAGNTFNVGFQGAKVSDQVDYVPWHDTNMAGTSFAPVTSEDGLFSSIQAAVNAAKHTTILLLPGIYTEDVLVDVEGVTIKGESLDAIVDGGFVLKADNITIDGLTIKNGMAAFTYRAIFTLASEVNPKPGSKGHRIINNDIIGSSTGGTSGYWAINLPALADQPVNILVDNNKIHGWRVGIMLEGYSTTITNNELYDNSKSGIDVERSCNNQISYNDIHDNGEYGIYIGKVVTTGNAINFNNIWANGEYGVLINPENNPGTVDATNNWWGNASGPSHSPGYGDKVSGNVDYEPWLLKKVIPGVDPITYNKTLALKDGWTLISVDKAVASSAWVGTEPLADGQEAIMAYKYTTAFGPATLANLEPLTAIYVKTKGGGGVGFNYTVAGDPAFYSKNLEAGWNLISTPSSEITANALLSQLRYATVGMQQVVGLTTLVSQGEYNQFSIDFYLATLIDADWSALESRSLNPFNGYWANMEAADTFSVPVR